MTRRPRDVGERPTCSQHPGSKIYLDRRVRMAKNGCYGDVAFRCVHADGRHLLPRGILSPRRITDGHPSAGVPCPSCGRAHDPAAGQTVGAGFTYSILEQARAMVLLGRGASYRDVAELIHADAFRSRQPDRPGEQGRPWVPRGQLDRSKPEVVADGAEPTLDEVKLAVEAEPQPDLTELAADDSGDTAERKYDYGREYPPTSLDGPYSKSATVITSWLDVYGPPIIEAYRPTAMPRALAIDSKPVNRRAFERNPFTNGITNVQNGISSGQVMTVVDATCSPGRPIVLVFEGTKDYEAWLRTFAMLPPGPAPKWVVADLDAAIEGAVRTVWPDAILYRCEEHLRNLIRKALRKDGVPERITPEEGKQIGAKAPTKGPVVKRRGHLDATIHPLFRLTGRAVMTAVDWAKFKAGVEKWLPQGDSATRKWVADHERLMAQQFALRAAHPGMPYSAGSAENVLRTVEDAFEKRVDYFANARRLDLLLGLVRIAAIGAASETRYSEIITRCVVERAGAGFDWQSGRDVLGSSSIDQRVADAISIGIATKERRAAVGRKRRVDRSIARADVERITAGLTPTLTPRVRRDDGGHSYYRIAKGSKVSDIPELATQWDPALNGGLLASDVPAGAGRVAWWTCRAHEAEGHLHIWKRRVIDRAADRSMCPFCASKQACPTRNLAAQYPDLMPDWASDLNPNLDPERLLPGSNVEAWWRCGVEGHPAWQTRICYRTKQRTGCPECVIEHRTRIQRERVAKRARRGRGIERQRRGETAPPVAGLGAVIGIPAPDDLALSEAAAILGRSVATLRNWVRSGRIAATEDTRTKKMMFWLTPQEVERLRQYSPKGVGDVAPKAA